MYSYTTFGRFLGDIVHALVVSERLERFFRHTEARYGADGGELVLGGVNDNGVFVETSKMVYFVPFSEIVAIAFASDITAHGGERGGETMSCTPTADSS